MHLSVLLQFLVVGYLLIITGYILFKQFNLQNISLFAVSFFTSLWTVSIVMLNLESSIADLRVSLFFTRLTFAAMALASISVLSFAKEFPVINTDRKSLTPRFNLTEWSLLFIGTTAGFVSLVTPFVVKDITIQNGIVEPVYNKLYLLFVLSIGCVGAYAIFLMFRKLKQLTGIQKSQVIYVLVGILFTAIVLLLTNSIIPILVNSSYTSQYGPLALTIFASFTSISILKYRLFDLRYLLGKIFTFIVIGIIIYGSFYGFIYLFDEILGGLYSSFILFFAFLIAMLYGIFIIQTYHILYSLILQRVFQIRFTLTDLIEEFQDKTSHELDLNNLIVILKDFFDKYLEVSQIKYIEKEVDDPNLWEMTQSIIKQDGNNHILINLEDIQKDRRYQINYDFLAKMITTGIKMLIPIKNDEMLGVFVFYSKKDNKAYTIEDIRFLRILARYTRALINKSILYEAVEDFNASLKIEIDKATKELQTKNVKLQETLRQERDMLDILAHELRTPLTIGRNAIKRIRNSQNDSKLTSESLKKFVEMAEENLEREAKILETMLSTTRIEHDKIQYAFQKVDINDVVNDSFLALSKNAKEKGLELTFNPVPDTFVYADRNRTQEVFDNLIDNAIKYTEKGSVSVNIEKKETSISIAITDTGIGIPPEEISKLGNKFYRINTYVDVGTESGYTSVRAGGTGLGLFVVYNLVKAMHGVIEVSSQVRKGSVFKVTLPAYTGQKEDNPMTTGEKLYERFERMKKEKAENIKP